MPRLLKYAWECPICGTDRLGIIEENAEVRNRIETHVVRHIKATKGEGHGELNQFPPDFDTSTVRNHLEVLGREETVSD